MLTLAGLGELAVAEVERDLVHVIEQDVAELRPAVVRQPGSAASGEPRRGYPV